MLTRLTDEEWTVVVTLSPAWFSALSATRSRQGKNADGGRWASLEMGGTRTVRRLAAMSAPLLPADAQPEAVTGPAANSSPTDLPPGSDAVLRVRRLQSDLRELIRHFACWAEASVLSVPAANDRAVPPAPPPRGSALEPHAALLVVAPRSSPAMDGCSGSSTRAWRS